MTMLAARTYPLLPLRKTVILPSTDARLTVGRPRSLEAVEAALATDHLLVVSTQHDGDDDEPSTDGLNRTGALVRIIDWDRRGPNTTQVLVVGISRATIHRVTATPAGYSAAADILPDPAAYSSIERALQTHVTDLYLQRVDAEGKGAAEAREELARCIDPSEIADYVGGQLIADWTERQRFLDTMHPADRLERLAVLLSGEADIADLDGRIRTRVRQQIDKSQREYYLREQLKVIHDELSGEAGNEIEAFRQKLEAAGLLEEALQKGLRELARLERMPSTSPEGGVIRGYLEWILALPWSTRSEDTYDINRTEAVLHADHHGLDTVKDRILEFLAVRELRARTEDRGTQRVPGTEADSTQSSVLSPQSSAPGAILCLVGPPGVGKTSLGQSIARSLGRSFVRISLGGVRDEAEVRGHRRTYVGALPGRLIHGLRQAKTRNPVILLDELDKMSSDYKGDPASAMLEVLDPAQNNAFTDHYMELPFDLSEVLFIATANTLDTIPRPLLDRMEIVQLGGYTEDEKTQIARRYLLPRQLAAHGLDRDVLDVPDKMLRHVVRYYTREAGVRNLERQLGAICRKAARKVVSGPLPAGDALASGARRIRVTAHLLEQYLGQPRRLQDVRNRPDQVGVAMGMAWTEVGGTLLPVEVATLAGKGAVVVTGRLGDVMQESAKAALSFARSRAPELGIAENFQETTDLHIHLPEGAIPKDGPSAGITMATGMISALTQRPVRADVAMTGEITLRGRVLPIGGLKEKVIAAHQAGIKTVIAPRDNEQDVADIPRAVQRELALHWVDTMDEVIALALAPESPLQRPPLHIVDQPGGYDLSLQVKGPNADE